MTFYKFLRAGRIGPFTGFRWPHGWVTGPAGPPAACHRGIHACRTEDLPCWLHDELWTIELDGEVVEGELKVVAPAGRLLERIAAWDETQSRRFKEFCVARVAWHAAEELEAGGLADLAQRLAEAAAQAHIGAVGKAAAGGMEEAARRGAMDTAELCGLANDAVALLGDGYPPPMMAYIAIRAADARTRAEGDPRAEERQRQRDWLVGELGLTD